MNEYAVALCYECGEPSVRIPITDWLPPKHNPRDGATYFIPIYDFSKTTKNCGCPLTENDTTEPEVVNYEIDGN